MLFPKFASEDIITHPPSLCNKQMLPQIQLSSTLCNLLMLIDDIISKNS